MSEKKTKTRYDARVLDAMAGTIEQHRQAVAAGEGTEKSRTVRLLTAGVPKIAQKVGEEATEAVIEAVRGKKKLLVEESVDLLYHLTVLWAASGVDPADVWAEVAKRHNLPEELERAMREDSKAKG